MRRLIVLFAVVLVGACTPPPGDPTDAAELAHFWVCTTRPTCVISDMGMSGYRVSDDGAVLFGPRVEPSSIPYRYSTELELVGIRDRWVRTVASPATVDDRIGGFDGDADLNVLAITATALSGVVPDVNDQSDVFFYNRTTGRLWRPAQPAGDVTALRVSSDGSRSVAKIGDSIVAFDVAADTYQTVATGYFFTPAISGNGDVVAWADGDFDRPWTSGDIFVADLTTGVTSQLGEAKAISPSLDFTGTRVAYWVDDRTDEDSEWWAHGSAVAVTDRSTGTRTVVSEAYAPWGGASTGFNGPFPEVSLSDDGSRVILVRVVPGAPYGDTSWPMEVADVSSGGGTVAPIAASLLTVFASVSHNGNRVLVTGTHPSATGPPSLVTTLWNR